MDLMEEWVHNANECLHLNLLRRSGESGKDERILDEPFHPTFTYPIFENEESIIGYKDPKIYLDFRANDLRPTLDVQYKHKMDLSSLLGDEANGKQTDIDTVFKDFLPSYVFDASEESESAGPDPSSKDWRPPGELVNSFEVQGKKYEIWSTPLSDPRALQIWRNMEILTLLYIEGASQLELEERWSLERWTLHLLYEVTPLEDPSVSHYTIAGFSTSHRYWILPTLDVIRATNSLPSPPHSTNGDASSSGDGKTHAESLFQLPTEFEASSDDKTPLTASVPCRERISQFLILPPYQGQSLGQHLYTTIFSHYVSQPNIYEVPVEDPSEAFDAMRDYADIVYLRSIPEFLSLEIASTVPAELLRKDAPIPRDMILGNGADINALRSKTKIVARQFNRMVELHLLSTIPPLHRNTARITRKAKSSSEWDRRYYFWRLAVKARIYAQNKDVLDQMEDSGERVDKLEDATTSQESEYAERLDGIERRQQFAEKETNGQAASSVSKGKRKRVVIEEDDGDEDWEDEDGDDNNKPRSTVAAKRPKVGDGSRS